MKLKDLLYVLRPIAADWHAFGIQLRVDYSKLATFKAFNSFVRRYLEIVLERWLGKDPPPKIQDIITALRQEDNNRLAMQLEEKYQGNQVLTTCRPFTHLGRVQQALLLSSLPGSLLKNGGGESLVTFVRKAFNFQHVIIVM